MKKQNGWKDEKDERMEIWLERVEDKGNERQNSYWSRDYLDYNRVHNLCVLFICFFFPWQGTEILSNLMAIMTDQEHWKHPNTFNPENFLDEKGQFCKNDSFLPFSLGESAASTAKPINYSEDINDTYGTQVCPIVQTSCKKCVYACVLQVRPQFKSQYS